MSSSGFLMWAVRTLSDYSNTARGDKLEVIMKREVVKVKCVIQVNGLNGSKDTFWRKTQEDSARLASTTHNPLLHILFIRCKQRNTHRSETQLVPKRHFSLRFSDEPRSVFFSVDNNNDIPAVFHVFQPCSDGSFVAVNSSSTHPDSQGTDAECLFTPHNERWLVASTITQRSALTLLAKALMVHSNTARKFR